MLARHPPRPRNGTLAARIAAGCVVVACAPSSGVLPEGTHRATSQSVKYFSWDASKNEKLKADRGISFEELVYHIERGDVLDVLENPNRRQYAGQRVFVVNVQGYAYLVPFVESATEVFLKTIIPSRKATRKYLQPKEPEDG
jgi:uncharacterized DUF497 family protein